VKQYAALPLGAQVVPTGNPKDSTILVSTGVGDCASASGECDSVGDP